jgi:hypothetical protein
MRLDKRSLIFTALALQPLNLLAVAIDLVLVTIDLLLLLIVGVLLALQLVTDQRTGAQSESAADRRSGTRMTDRRADEATSRRAAERTNSGALFARG